MFCKKLEKEVEENDCLKCELAKYQDCDTGIAIVSEFEARCDPDNLRYI